MIHDVYTREIINILFITFFTTFFIIKNVYKTSFYNTKRPFVLNPVALTVRSTAIPNVS